VPGGEGNAGGGLFITATDTGVGKSILTACLLAQIDRCGLPVSALKPLLTGTAQEPEEAEHDHELLARIARRSPEQIALFTFPLPAAPQLAAQAAGRPLQRAQVLERCLQAVGQARREGQIVLVEGVGGLLVPIAPGLLVRDLARELALPVLIAARPGLGTINHTLLTIESARAAGLSVRAVVLTPWPARPGLIERSNRRTIERLGEVAVAVLPTLRERSRAAFARAGAKLPWRDWVGMGAHAR
jgi:dethiobiotin synthetase